MWKRYKWKKKKRISEENQTSTCEVRDECLLQDPPRRRTLIKISVSHPQYQPSRHIPPGSGSSELGRIGPAPVSAAHWGGYRSVLFVRQGLQIGWFLSCGWAAPVLFTLLSDGEECEGCRLWEMSTSSQLMRGNATAGFETGVCDFFFFWGGSFLVIKSLAQREFWRTNSDIKWLQNTFPSNLLFHWWTWRCDT